MQKLFLCIALMLCGAVQGMDLAELTGQQKAIVAVCKTLEAFAAVAEEAPTYDLVRTMEPKPRSVLPAWRMRGIHFGLKEEQHGSMPRTTRELWNTVPPLGSVDEYDEEVIEIAQGPLSFYNRSYYGRGLYTPWGICRVRRPAKKAHFTQAMKEFFARVQCTRAGMHCHFDLQERVVCYEVTGVDGELVDQRAVERLFDQYARRSYTNKADQQKEIEKEWNNSLVWYLHEYLPAKKSLELAPEPAQALPSDA